jgi:hypothetical protein
VRLLLTSPSIKGNPGKEHQVTACPNPPSILKDNAFPAKKKILLGVNYKANISDRDIVT